MNNLYRELAPITESAWSEIELHQVRYSGSSLRTCAMTMNRSSLGCTIKSCHKLSLTAASSPLELRWIRF